jgi:adhesin transport system membrane fusion protein
VDAVGRGHPSHQQSCVSVRVDTENLGVRQQKIEMSLGLQANVELNTGEKTVLHYLTKSLSRSQEALHEK